MQDSSNNLRANLESQKDELEALEAIYGEDLELADSETFSQCKSFYVSIPGDHCIRLLIHLPELYPSHECPIVEIYESFGISISECDKIVEDLAEIYERSGREVCLYEWIESVREKFGTSTMYEADSLPTSEVDSRDLTTPIPAPTQDVKPFLRTIKTGIPITDRKSTFQANVVEVHSVEEVRDFVAYLLTDRKIARATHNMLAYRIVSDVVIKDSDDDGEGGAGSKLSHLLEMTQAENVAVVVSRWYGGIQLGPDRFKHISNSAREVLETNGFIAQKTKK